MASILKRKRGAVAVPETEESPKPVLKRAKSVEADKKNGQASLLPSFDAVKTGWDAVFGSKKKGGEVAKVNGNGVDDEAVNGVEEESEEGEDFDTFVTRSTRRWKKKGHKNRARREMEEALRAESAWKASDPIAGRMLDIDPVFTADEKYVPPPQTLALELLI